jgi:hypothetical protein
MDPAFSSEYWAVTLLFFLTVIINLPFGYARTRSKRYSLRWFLYIHVPIPVILIIRVMSHIEMKYIPIFALGALIGQIIGGKLDL